MDRNDSSSGLNKNLELAYQHTASNWFPVTPAVLSSIRSRLDSGYYTKNRQALIDDIKSDFSLYLYCLRELQRMLMLDDCSRESSSKGKALSGKKTRSLSETIQLVPLEYIDEVLSAGMNEISPHSMDELTDMHAYRLREAVLSASTTETMAEKLEIDPDFGFTCALLRQLGLTLIAWNYPNVYHRALRSLDGLEETTEETLDTVLHSALGYSPAMLGARFAQSWGLASEVMAIVNAPEEGKVSLEELPRTSWRQSILLEKLCTVGEALARADSPENYPRAKDDWDSALPIIRRHLGPEGIRIIYERAKSLSASYADYAPEVLSVADGAETTLALGSDEYTRSLFEQNEYLQECPEFMQKKIADVYSGLEPNTISQDTLRSLVQEIIPSLGFDTVCVFMLDPSTSTLSPVLKVGSPVFIQTNPVNIKDYRMGSSQISAGYWQEEPFSKDGTLQTGKKKKFLVGALGLSSRVGVLYLEMAEKPPEGISPKAMTVFRALQQCMNDLLHLK